MPKTLIKVTQFITCMYMHEIFVQNIFWKKTGFLFRIKSSLLMYKFVKKINTVDNVTYYQICFESKFKIKAMFNFLLAYLFVFCFWFCLSFYISFSFCIVLLYFTFCKKTVQKITSTPTLLLFCFAFPLLRSFFTFYLSFLFCFLLFSNLLLLCGVIFYYFFVYYFFPKFLKKSFYCMIGLERSAWRNK